MYSLLQIMSLGVAGASLTATLGEAGSAAQAARNALESDTARIESEVFIEVRLQKGARISRR